MQSATPARPIQSDLIGTVLVPVLALVIFINYVDRGSLAITSPLIKDQLHFSSTQIGILLSAFFWTYVPAQIKERKMLAFASRLFAVRPPENIEFQDISHPITALPGAGSSERRALLYFSKRCVTTHGVVILAGISAIVAAALTDADPKRKIALYVAGGAAILASCCGVIGHAISVNSNRRDTAARPLLPEIQLTRKIVESKRVQVQPATEQQIEQEGLRELQQSFDELLRAAPPCLNNIQDVLAGPMQIALEDSIRGWQDGRFGQPAMDPES